MRRGETLHTSTIGGVWHEVVGTQPHPSWWLVGVTGVVALVAVSFRSVWHVLRNVVTIAHEGGHAFAALVTGRQLQGIRLHSDTSGVTVSRGRPYGPGMIVTAFAGYVTPPLLGLGAAGLLAAGHITALLWASIVLLAAILVMVRNAYGVVSVVTTGAVIFAVSWYGSATVQAAFAYAFTWFLLLAGARPVVELQSKRSGGRAPDSDADQLARLTGMPGLLWVFGFGVVAVAALLAGGSWLLPDTMPQLPSW
ncbi:MULTISPECIES: M50 family metallopeptidase [Actinoallomurus]|uniref:M50 family metallopeptidase n=1 Tax=Actinoallomurus TaxID=667113 RepID=UPI0020910E67|nr:MULTISPECIES: M50 family metallopeptidase [Actinoallomurus]MCO5969648.1 M50 family metallopeptidase [Actinoallomurus soli]MCO5993292.1 M50 family metallopeptidase [Actinoallomurus rhizosphaericola]